MLINRKNREAMLRFVMGTSVLLWVVAPVPIFAQEIDGRTIVSKVENRLWGSTSQGRYEMTITTPHWQRTLKMQVWMQRPKYTFIRIL